MHEYESPSEKKNKNTTLYLFGIREYRYVSVLIFLKINPLTNYTIGLCGIYLDNTYCITNRYL